MFIRIGLYFVIGLCLGSFHVCQADRMIKREPWWKGRSRCDQCGHVLSLLDVIPVVSVWIHHGRCRYCQQSVWKGYAGIEIVMGCLCAVIAYKQKDNLIGIGQCIWLGQMLTILLVDWKTYQIPNHSLVFCVFVWLLEMVFTNQEAFGKKVLIALGYMIGLSLLRFLLHRVYNKDCLGVGDVLLYGVCGLRCVGYQFLCLLWLSSVLGMLTVWKRGENCIPFAPCIVAAMAILMVIS